MKRWIEKLFARRVTRPARRSNRPGLESLEARLAPAFGLAIAGAEFDPVAELSRPIAYDGASQTVAIRGTEFADVVVVTSVEYLSGQTTLLVTLNGESRTFDLSTPVARVLFAGGDGNDVFANRTDVPCEAAGGDGDDTLSGGGGADTLRGEAGVDVLAGGGGQDVLEGGDQNDLLSGGDANDRLYGGDGNDVLSGGSGADYLYGEGGHDDLDSDVEDAVRDGGAGVDYLRTGGDPADGTTDGFVPYDGAVSVVTVNDNVDRIGLVTLDTNSALDLNARLNAPQPDGQSLQQKASATLSQKLEEFRFEGQNLYDITLNVVSQGELAVSSDGQGAASLRLTLRDNYLEATSTQPVFGKWADPRLSLRFDLTLTMPLASNGLLSVGTPTVEIRVTEIDSHNAVADVAFFVLGVSRAVGNDLEGPIAQLISDKLNENDDVKSGITSALSGLSGLSGQSLPQGLIPSVVYDVESGRLLVRVPRVSLPLPAGFGTPSIAGFDSTHQDWTPQVIEGLDAVAPLGGQGDGMDVWDGVLPWFAEPLTPNPEPTPSDFVLVADLADEWTPTWEADSWWSGYAVSDVDQVTLNPQPLPPSGYDVSDVVAEEIISTPSYDVTVSGYVAEEVATNQQSYSQVVVSAVVVEPVASYVATAADYSVVAISPKKASYSYFGGDSYSDAYSYSTNSYYDTYSYSYSSAYSYSSYVAPSYYDAYYSPYQVSRSYYSY